MTLQNRTRDGATGTHARVLSKLKKLGDLSISVIRAMYRVSNGSWVLVNLMVVTAGEALVAEEVNSGVVDTSWQVLLVLDVVQAVGLVPALGKDVKGDLATNRVAINH